MARSSSAIIRNKPSRVLSVTYDSSVASSGFEYAEGNGFFRHGIVSLAQFDLRGRMRNDGLEFRLERRVGGLFEVLRRRIVAARQNSFGIGQTHLLQRLLQQHLALRHGGFGRAVHRGDELVQLIADAEHAHHAFGFRELRRQVDFHLGVLQETVGHAQLSHRAVDALIESLFQARRRVAVRQGAQVGADVHCRSLRPSPEPPRKCRQAGSIVSCLDSQRPAAEFALLCANFPPLRQH